MSFAVSLSGPINPEREAGEACQIGEKFFSVSFVLMRELNSVNILKAVENGLQAIPDGKPLLRKKTKEEAITLIKDTPILTIFFLTNP